MPIDYDISVENDMLVVKAFGKDDDLESVMAYSRAVAAAAVKNDCRQVLCDERDLKYALNNVDTFHLAEFCAKFAPLLQKAAIVCDPAHLDDGQFWGTAVSNRGAYVKVFTDIAKARCWLTSG